MWSSSCCYRLYWIVISHYWKLWYNDKVAIKVPNKPLLLWIYIIMYWIYWYFSWTDNIYALDLLISRYSSIFPKTLKVWFKHVLISKKVKTYTIWVGWYARSINFKLWGSWIIWHRMNWPWKVDHGLDTFIATYRVSQLWEIAIYRICLFSGL